jgi:hypothetical protein
VLCILQFAQFQSVAREFSAQNSVREGDFVLAVAKFGKETQDFEIQPDHRDQQTEGGIPFEMLWQA